MIGGYRLMAGVSATRNLRLSVGEEAIGDVDGNPARARPPVRRPKKREIDVIAGCRSWTTFSAKASYPRTTVWGHTQAARYRVDLPSSDARRGERRSRVRFRAARNFWSGRGSCPANRARVIADPLGQYIHELRARAGLSVSRCSDTRSTLLLVFSAKPFSRCDQPHGR